MGASTLITPDIPLMFFSVVFIYSAYCYIEENNTRYAYLTGIAAGAMLLSKYPGILIIFTTLLYILMYKREIFTQKYIYIAMSLAIIVFSPVLYWNYQNDFISFTFQLHHGIAQEKVFHPKEFFNFIGAQLILFHPLYLLPLLYFIATDTQRFEKKKVFLLLPFLFVVGFFSYFAAFKHANAQWAATAYLTAAVLLGYYFAHHNVKKLFIVALSLSGVIFLLIKTPIGVEFVPPVKKLFSRLGKIDNFKQEIANLHLNIDQYDYILIDDYHGSEIPYMFRKYNNILVLNTARTSNFNLWRYEDLNISMQSPIPSIPT
jgi:4-amino-4-deoxy-L-arabinose transferase-like glycosyltransferase